MKNYLLLFVLLLGNFAHSNDNYNKEISGDLARGLFGILYCSTKDVKFSLDGYIESHCGFTEASSDAGYVRVRSAHNQNNIDIDVTINEYEYVAKIAKIFAGLDQEQLGYKTTALDHPLYGRVLSGIMFFDKEQSANNFQCVLDRQMFGKDKCYIKTFR